jgi:hypothetical protein
VRIYYIFGLCLNQKQSQSNPRSLPAKLLRLSQPLRRLSLQPKRIPPPALVKNCPSRSLLPYLSIPNQRAPKLWSRNNNPRRLQTRQQKRRARRPRKGRRARWPNLNPRLNLGPRNRSQCLRLKPRKHPFHNLKLVKQSSKSPNLAPLKLRLWLSLPRSSLLPILQPPRRSMRLRLSHLPRLLPRSPHPRSWLKSSLKSKRIPLCLASVPSIQKPLWVRVKMNLPLWKLNRLLGLNLPSLPRSPRKPRKRRARNHLQRLCLMPSRRRLLVLCHCRSSSPFPRCRRKSGSRWKGLFVRVGLPWLSPATRKLKRRRQRRCRNLWFGNRSLLNKPSLFLKCLLSRLQSLRLSLKLLLLLTISSLPSRFPWRLTHLNYS